MTMIETLAKRGNKAAKAVMDAWNPDQERDDKGMWTSGGGATAVTAEQHSGAARAHREAASLGGANAGRHLAAASAHERAAQNARAISVSADVLRQHSGHMEMSNSANALTRSLENDKGSYKGNPAAEGARAVAAEEHERQKDILRVQWDNSNNYRLNLQEASNRGNLEARAKLAEHTKAHEELSAKLRDFDKSSARTMTELPAIKETPSKQLAMSQRVPASSSPGKDKPVMGSDPNKTTQKEMPVVGSGGQNWGGQRTAVGGKAAQASINAEKAGSAKLHQSAAQAHYEASREARFGSPERAFHEKASQYHKTATYEISKNESSGRGSKQSRQEKAAAVAGEWASRALTAKSVGPTERVMPSGRVRQKGRNW